MRSSYMVLWAGRIDVEALGEGRRFDGRSGDPKVGDRTYMFQLRAGPGRTPGPNGARNYVFLF